MCKIITKGVDDTRTHKIITLRNCAECVPVPTAFTWREMDGMSEKQLVTHFVREIRLGHLLCVCVHCFSSMNVEYAIYNVRHGNHQNILRFTVSFSETKNSESYTRPSVTWDARYQFSREEQVEILRLRTQQT